MLALYIVLSIYIYMTPHLHFNKAVGEGKEGIVEKLKEIIDQQRGYTTKRQGKECRYDGNFELFRRVLTQ